MNLIHHWVQAIKSNTAKTVYFLQNPIQGSAVVARTVAQVVSGQTVTRNNITPQQRASSHYSIGDALALPVAAVGGGAAGTVTGAIASAFGEKSKAAKYTAAHPVEVGAAVGVAALAPAALYYLTGATSNLKDSFSHAGPDGHPDAGKPGGSAAHSDPHRRQPRQVRRRTRQQPRSRHRARSVRRTVRRRAAKHR